MPRMLVSSVETGLRLATPTVACAARCRTVTISYSPRARSIDLLVPDVAADDPHAVEQRRRDQLGLRYPVAYEHHDVGAAVDEALHEPAAEKPRAPGHEHRPVPPERRGRSVPIPRRRCESPPEKCRARAGRCRCRAASAAAPRCSTPCSTARRLAAKRPPPTPAPLRSSIGWTASTSSREVRDTRATAAVCAHASTASR